MEAIEKQKAIVGGEFIIRETKAQDIFIPEEWNEEQKMKRAVVLGIHANKNE